MKIACHMHAHGTETNKAHAHLKLPSSAGLARCATIERPQPGDYSPAGLAAEAPQKS
jgi:hypothetical protein